MSKDLVLEFIKAAFRLEISNSFQIRDNIISVKLPNEKTVKITIAQTK